MGDGELGNSRGKVRSLEYEGGITSTDQRFSPCDCILQELRIALNDDRTPFVLSRKQHILC